MFIFRLFFIFCSRKCLEFFKHLTTCPYACNLYSITPLGNYKDESLMSDLNMLLKIFKSKTS